jgi:hypothetical protein
VMILYRAAGLPIYAAHRDSQAYRTAESIVRVARGETMFEVRRPRRDDFTVPPKVETIEAISAAPAGRGSRRSPSD